MEFFATQDMEFCSKGPVTVHAVTADIFTTRAACDNCKKGSINICDLKEHFFQQALAQIGGVFEVAPGVMKLVRLDCAVPHNNTPDQPTTLITPLQPKCVLHALPSKGTGHASGENVFQINCLIDVNQAAFILQAFTESRELTELERLLQTSRQLGTPIKQRSEIPGELSKTFRDLAQRDPDTFLRLALELEMKMELSTQEALKQLERGGMTGPGDTQQMRKLRTVIMSGLQAGIAGDKILSMIVRNYKDFGMAYPDEVVGKASAACKYQYVTGTDPKKFAPLIPYFQNDSVTPAVKEGIAREIEDLVKAGDDDSLQQAQQLANDFGQQKAYDTAVQRKKEEEVRVN